MSASREKDQKDFDLEQIVKIFDQALGSDDQRIKDALRALLTVTVLCTAEHPDQKLRNGPLARVLEDYSNLARRLSHLEDDVRRLQMQPKATPYTPPIPGITPYPRESPVAPPLVWDPPLYTTTWSASDDPNYKGSSATSVDLDFTQSVIRKVVKWTGYG